MSKGTNTIQLYPGLYYNIRKNIFIAGAHASIFSKNALENYNNGLFKMLHLDSKGLSPKFREVILFDGKGKTLPCENPSLSSDTETLNGLTTGIVTGDGNHVVVLRDGRFLGVDRNRYTLDRSYVFSPELPSGATVHVGDQEALRKFLRCFFYGMIADMGEDGNKFILIEEEKPELYGAYAKSFFDIAMPAISRLYVAIMSLRNSAFDHSIKTLYSNPGEILFNKWMQIVTLSMGHVSFFTQPCLSASPSNAKFRDHIELDAMQDGYTAIGVGEDEAFEAGVVKINGDYSLFGITEEQVAQVVQSTKADPSAAQRSALFEVSDSDVAF